MVATIDAHSVVGDGHFRQFFDSSPIGMAIVATDGSAEGRLVEVNQAFADLLGYQRSELVGRHHDAFTRPEDHGPGRRYAALSDREPQRPAVFEKRFVHRDGRVICAEVSMTSTPGADGETVRLVHVEDITDRQAQQEAADLERDRLRGLVRLQREVTLVAGDRDAVLDLVVRGALELLLHADGAVVELPRPGAPGGAELLEYVAVGGRLDGFLGVTVDAASSLSGLAMRGDQVLRADDTDDDPRVDAEACRRTGVRSMLIAPLLAGDRTVGVLKVAHADPHAFDDDDVQLLVAIAHCLVGALRVADDHARLADAVQVATERAQLLELASDAVIVRGMEDEIRYWNGAAERMYGWRANDVAGCNLERLLGTRSLNGDDPEEMRRRLLAVGTWEGELEHHAADGRRVVVRSRKALQRDERGAPVGILTINTDITARREAEEALASSEALFRSQYVHSGVGLSIRGADDVLESVNPALARMLGYDDPDDLVGTSARHLVSAGVHEERGSALAAIYSGETDSISYETRLLRRDGTEVDVHFTTSALRDADGYPARFVSIFQDIGARKRAERARDAAMSTLEEHNRQLAAAGQLKTDLIGMLGHEINNPLAVLQGTLELAELRNSPEGAALLVEPPDLGDLLDVVRRNVGRIAGTVREILALVTSDAGRLSARPSPVRVVEHLRDLLSSAAPDAALTGDGDLSALVQPEHLDQVVTNLVTNAAKYGGGVDEVTVDVAGDHLEIAFVDHGDGVPEAFAPRVFDRFARAEESATTTPGTGLGLFISRELARANEGDLMLRATPGGGATFVLQLPRG